MSLVEDESLAQAQQTLELAADKLVLPIDVVVAEKFAADAEAKTTGIDSVPPGWRILDIGPKTLGLFKESLTSAKTVLWNGPMGVFEFPRFACGTVKLAEILAETEASGTPLTGTPGDNGFGSIQSGFLEKSNVQMVTELVNLITAQRAYEINSRAIKAGDDMLRTANGIVR